MARLAKALGIIALMSTAAAAQGYDREMYESGPMGTPPAMSTAPLPYGTPFTAYPAPYQRPSLPPPLPPVPAAGSYVPDAPAFPYQGQSIPGYGERNWGPPPPPESDENE